MFALISQAIAFGFAAGTGFGPLHTILMNVTLSMGWRQGLLIVLSPLVSDVPIILLMLFLLDRLPGGALQVIQIAGGIAVLVIAWRTWRQLDTLEQRIAADTGVPVSRETLIKGVVVNFLNPNPYLYWGTITGPLLIESMAISVGVGVAFLLGFYVTFLGILTIFVFFFDRIRGINPQVTRRLTQFSVLLLILLGFSIILGGLGIL